MLADPRLPPTLHYRHPDLLEPHILRSLSNVKAVSVHTSCAGCHTIVLDIEGTAWLFGRNQPAALGIPNFDTISENAPSPLRATDLGAPPGTIFVNAACGRSHSVLIGSNGRVWTAGLNALGQVKNLKKKFFSPVLKNFKKIVRALALRGSQHIHACKRASESGIGRVGARMRRSSWHHIYAIPYRKRKEHVMLAFCFSCASVADTISQFMPAGAERRASLETDVQGNISPRGTVQVLTLKASPVSKTICSDLDAHDDCISSRQGSGG